MARQMKDSGIEWIGEIPESWDTIKFKYLFSIIGGNGFPENLQGQTEGTYPFCKVSDINGHSDYVDTAANYVSDEVAKEHGFNIIPCGSIIIAKIGAALQKNHRKINSVPCCIDNNTQALVPIRADSLRYLLYLTRCIDMGWFDNNSTVPSLNNNKLLNFFVPNVSEEEQQRIAAFLDRKCAEIDAVIERTKATIEEYKKLRQAVITEAVTKGVRGPRPMKDSGIEWIGEIPEGWRTMPLKAFVDILPGYAFSSDDFCTEKGIPLLRGINVAPNSIRWDETVRYDLPITDQLAPFQLQEGDIVVGLDRPWISDGTRIAWVTAADVPSLLLQRVCRIRAKAEIDLRWVFHWIASNAFQESLSTETTGVSVPHISTKQIGNFVIAFPGYDEQRETCDYLDEKCAALDTLIAKKTALLTELETYKKSLIYEYVTGKKEVTA